MYRLSEVNEGVDPGSGFLVWDWDCLLIDDFGIDGWSSFVERHGESMGLIDGSPGQEFVSGSIKCKISG